MAAAWFSVLKNLPWSDVIVAAPSVAQGAKKLWSTVAGKPAEPAQPSPNAARAADTSPQAEPGAVDVATRADIDALRSRLEAGDAATAELRAQMRSSTELIRALADHNTQLVAGLDVATRRLRWLAGALVLVGACAGAALVIAWLR